MDKRLLPFLCCPVTQSPLRLEVIRTGSGDTRPAQDEPPIAGVEPLATEASVLEGLLFGAEDWCYPVIGGIPRLNVEAFLDHAEFLRAHLPDYMERKWRLLEKYPRLIAYVQRKNRRTKKSFALEWSLHDYSQDRTWEASEGELLQRFLDESGETAAGLVGKLVFDAGCGNGQLDTRIARAGARVIAMDLSSSIERAYAYNDHPDVWFIQGDLQFPPVRPGVCDILQCSGVLHHTNDTQLSFNRLEPCVRVGGTYSVWLYHPRKDRLHRLFNAIRVVTSRWPVWLTYGVLRCTALPLSWLVHRLKGHPKNKREIMIALMDWFSPEFRREHTPDEVRAWYGGKGYHDLRMTTHDTFGFNFIGKKAAI
jgi:2-polyprenyl-3-methyl-5-hydroxy-6-metoxy-1,4-benzoquinol methylase/uncharacterized protein YbaR (Trm112 family)